MYIVFPLPNGAGGIAAGRAVAVLRHTIQKWSEQYSISYKTKIHKYTLRLCLPRDEDYTFFQLSWNISGHYEFYQTRYSIITTES